MSNDNSSTIQQKLREIAENIDKQKNSIAEIYWNIYKAANMILSEAKAENSNQGSAVDIDAVARYFKLAIVESEMHSNRNFIKNEVMGFIDIYDEESECCSNGTIYINENLGDLSKRYAVAHEIAHYYFKEIGTENVNHCIKMLFPKTGIEQLCDIMASFLLMPIEKVLKLLNAYLAAKSEEGACPVYAEDCLRYLGHELKISDFHVMLCYQHVLYLGGILREKKIDKDDENIFTDMDAYGKLLC